MPTWTNLNHSSIAAFRGVNMGIFPLALVHDWAENGNIIRYLKSHPDAPRLALVPNLLPCNDIRLITFGL